MHQRKIKITGILLIVVFILTSCVASNKTDTQSSLVYGSKEYVLTNLEKGGSLGQLAKIHLGDEKLTWKIEDANEQNAFTDGSLITVPLTEKHRGGLFEQGYQSVPILCYHKFGPNQNSPLAIPTAIFDAQMKYLTDNGYRVITPDMLLNFLEYKRQIPKKSVLITIDDGYKSVISVAFPILKKYGFTATVFVYTKYVGISKKAMSWDDLRILKANGFTIGSHTVYHSDLTQKESGETTKVFFERINMEINLSKTIIDKKLDQNTIYFAFPYGRYNTELLKKAKSAGYKMAVTVDRGSNPFFTNPLALKRDMILKRDMNSFISRLKTFNNISLK